MDSLEDRLQSILGCDVYYSEFDSVVVRVSAATQHTELLKLCEAAYIDRRSLNSQSSRVCFARILVALLPRSLSFIEEVLRSTRDLLDFEVHFSLFCYLDDVQWYEHLKPASTRVLTLVRDYLMRTEQDTASALWMAVDLIADHWEFEEALQTLVDVARRGQTPAGRIEAIEGISQMATRAPAWSNYEETSQSLLRSILRFEKEEEVKLTAQHFLGRAPEL